MPTFIHLLRREIVEHRNGMLLTPAIIAALLALALIFGSITGTEVLHFKMDQAEQAIELQELQEEMNEVMPEIKAGLGLALHVLALPMLAIAMIVAAFMLLGSLYDERSERTILFWKSMPVSDTMTVLSKLTTGALLIPAAAMIAGFALQIIALIVFAVFGTANSLPIGFNIFGMAPLIQVWWNTTILLIFGALWAAPLLSWLVLASALAPRTPFLFAVVPIATIALFEGFLNESAWVLQQIADRFLGAGLFEVLGERFERLENLGHSGDLSLDVSIHITLDDIGQILTTPGLWIGLIIAAIFTAGAIHIRRTKTL